MSQLSHPPVPKRKWRGVVRALMATERMFYLWFLIVYVIYQDPSHTIIKHIIDNCTSVDVRHIGVMNTMSHSVYCDVTGPLWHHQNLMPRLGLWESTTPWCCRSILGMKPLQTRLRRVWNRFIPHESQASIYHNQCVVDSLSRSPINTNKDVF